MASALRPCSNSMRAVSLTIMRGDPLVFPTAAVAVTALRAEQPQLD